MLFVILFHLYTVIKLDIFVKHSQSYFYFLLMMTSDRDDIRSFMHAHSCPRLSHGFFTLSIRILLSDSGSDICRCIWEADISSKEREKEVLLLLFVYVASGSWPIRNERAHGKVGLKDTGVKTACFGQRLNWGAITDQYKINKEFELNC